MKLIWLLIPLLFFGIIGTQESFAVDLQYGEYISLGNSWIELTHSAANPPPWLLDWRINHPGENYDNEKEVAEKFYAKYDVRILDLISSSKNAQFCEAVGCLWGTYHLLIPNEDVEKFNKGGFGFVEFAEFGIHESNAGSDGSLTANWVADFFLSTNGTLNLSLELDYTSKEILKASYCSSGCREKTYVDVDEFYFVDSFVFVNYPYSGSNPTVIGLVADSESKNTATINLVTDLNYKGYTPDIYNYGSIGLSWVRLFADSEGQRYHQWMRSNTSDMFEMNKKHHVNGTLSVSNLTPEIYAKKSTFNFDYYGWLKENYLKNKSPAEQIKSKAVRSYEVQCKEGLELIFKYTHSTPKCVKPETAEKLLERKVFMKYQRDVQIPYAVSSFSDALSIKEYCELNRGEWNQDSNVCTNGLGEYQCKTAGGVFSYTQCPVGSTCPAVVYEYCDFSKQ